MTLQECEGNTKWRMLGIYKIIRELWRAHFQITDKHLSKNIGLGTRWMRLKGKFLDLSVIKWILELIVPRSTCLT